MEEEGGLLDLQKEVVRGKEREAEKEVEEDLGGLEAEENGWQVFLGRNGPFWML